MLKSGGEIIDRLSAMAMLLKVAETASFSGAARALDVPLATVSRRMAELEAHLQARVLNRSSRGISLTEAGRYYLESCKVILQQVEDAERAARGVHGTPRGQLVVTAPVVFGRTHLGPILFDFLQAYPEIDVRLVLADRLLNLLESDIDIALRIGDLEDSNLVATRVGVVRRVTCASRSYLLAQGRPQHPQDLRQHTCVTFDNLAPPSAWRFSSSHGPLVVPIRSRLTVTTAEAALDAAIAGLGLTRLLSYQVARYRQAGLLDVVLQEYELSPWPVSLIHAKQQLLPNKARAFLEFAAPRLKATLDKDTLEFDTKPRAPRRAPNQAGAAVLPPEVVPRPLASTPQRHSA